MVVFPVAPAKDPRRCSTCSSARRRQVQRRTISNRRRSFVRQLRLGFRRRWFNPAETTPRWFTRYSRGRDTPRRRCRCCGTRRRAPCRRGFNAELQGQPADLGDSFAIIGERHARSGPPRPRAARAQLLGRFVWVVQTAACRGEEND